LRKLALVVSVSEPTMRRIAEKDLRYKSYILKTDRLRGCQDQASCSLQSAAKEFWPPNSPDLNPLDYYMWSVVERITNKSRHPKVTSLRTAIKAADINSATLQRACERFRSRIEAMIEVDEGYIG